MFGISFFSNKVAHHLFRMGLTPQDMPQMNVFKPLCDALKENGYDAEHAAELWMRCLSDDKAAIEELRKHTGIYGSTLFER